MPDRSQPQRSPQVFINCLFDDPYWPLMKAMMFAVQACGFWPRCSRESDDAGEVRLEKIIRLIRECRLGIHDLSRKGSDLAPLCANCHAMADRLTLNHDSPPRSIAELKNLLLPSSSNQTGTSLQQDGEQGDDSNISHQ